MRALGRIVVHRLQAEPSAAPLGLGDAPSGARVGGLRRVVAIAERLGLWGFPLPGAGELPP